MGYIIKTTAYPVVSIDGWENWDGKNYLIKDDKVICYTAGKIIRAKKSDVNTPFKLKEWFFEGFGVKATDSEIKSCKIYKDISTEEADALGGRFFEYMDNIKRK